MKKIIAALLTVMLLMSACLPATCAHVSYLEDAGDWARASISKAFNAKIVDSYMLADYHEPICRLYAVCLLMNAYRALKNPISYEIKSPFEDASSYLIANAYALGIVDGVRENFFDASAPITREAFAAILNRMVIVTEHTLPKADLSVFEDSAEISDWATEHMEAMVGAKIIQGVSEKSLAPQSTLTTEQAIVMVWRLYRELGGEDVLLYEETTMDILCELGLVSAEELADTSESITEFEFLKILCKIRGGSDFFDSVTEEEENKAMDACLSGGLWAVLEQGDIEGVPRVIPLTYKMAYVYALRLTSGTSGCLAGGILYEGGLVANDAENREIIVDARNYGLLVSDENVDLNEKISRQEAYELIHKALFAEFFVGGVAGSTLNRMYNYCI